MITYYVTWVKKAGFTLIGYKNPGMQRIGQEPIAECLLEYVHTIKEY